MNLGEKFALIEDISVRVSADLREVDPDCMDADSREYLFEAYGLIRILEDVMLGNMLWDEAKRATARILYGGDSCE